MSLPILEEADIELGTNEEITESHQERRTFIRKVYTTLSIQIVLEFIFCFIWPFADIPQWLEDSPIFFFLFLILAFVFIIVLSFSQKIALAYPLNYITFGMYTIINTIVGSTYFFTSSAVPLVITSLVTVCTVAICICTSHWTMRDFTDYGKKVVRAIISIICFDILITILYGFDILTLTAVYILFNCSSIVFYVTLAVSLLCLSQLIFSRHKNSFQLTEHMRAVFLLSINISILFIFVLIDIDSIYFYSS